MLLSEMPTWLDIILAQGVQSDWGHDGLTLGRMAYIIWAEMKNKLEINLKIVHFLSVSYIWKEIKNFFLICFSFDPGFNLENILNVISISS